MQELGEEAMDQAAGMIIIYTTLPVESDARKIGAELIGKRLAACVNIFPGMVSIYRWQGAVETAGETAMLVKNVVAYRLAGLKFDVLGDIAGAGVGGDINVAVGR